MSSEHPLDISQGKKLRAGKLRRTTLNKCSQECHNSHLVNKKQYL